jgi:Fur family peroxide stress response transcriptional regulator
MQLINDTRITEMCQKLHDSGHRMTPQRLCILQALVGSNRHPSAEDIYAQVQRVSPMTSLATVYKTLETLRDIGEALEMEVGDGRRHYDAVHPQFHPHVICTQCGQIEDVEIDGLSGLQIRAGQVSGYEIKAQRVEFYGLCQACQTAPQK